MNNQASVTRHYHFCAAHRLHAKELSDDVNRKVFGKCNNLNGHGHNYTVLVTVRGDMNPQTGEVTDLERLDRLVATAIVERFDHKHLNHDPVFHEIVTTGENVAKFIWDELVEAVPVGKLDTIGLIETRDNYFEYQG